MRIITFKRSVRKGPYALTREEFNTVHEMLVKRDELNLALAKFNVPESAMEDWPEWEREFVWQEQPSKEAAITRHTEAWGALCDDVNAGQPEKEFY